MRPYIYPVLLGMATVIAAAMLIVGVRLAIVVFGDDGIDAPRNLAEVSRGLPDYWIVRRHQTYTSIAAETGLHVDELEQLNPKVDPDTLVPGQRLRLRPDSPRPDARRDGRPRVTSRFWIVRRGQTLSSIAARTGVSIGRIVQLNPKLKPELLQPGQRVRLRR